MKNSILMTSTRIALLATLGALSACGDGGTDGQNLLFKTSAIAPGAVCADGGTLFEAGLDTNGNAVLDASEVTSKANVCNGSSSSGTGPAGPVGPEGPKGDDIIIKVPPDA